MVLVGCMRCSVFVWFGRFSWLCIVWFLNVVWIFGRMLLVFGVKIFCCFMLRMGCIV